MMLPDQEDKESLELTDVLGTISGWRKSTLVQLRETVASIIENIDDDWPAEVLIAQAEEEDCLDENDVDDMLYPNKEDRG